MLHLRRNRKAEADDASATPLLASPGPTPREEALANDYDTASSWAEEEDQLSREKLQMIKARTMYEMVEEVELKGGPCKLLFLTNAQAELLAHSDASLQKMLDALEVPKPQLVINLLDSGGSRQSAVANGPTGFDVTAAGSQAGRVSNKVPFLTKEEEQAAERRIDRFMENVLIPLASQTNAVVITSNFRECMLSASLMRMYALRRSMWGARPPFTIINAGAGIPALYLNGDFGSTWREVRRQSRAWRGRDKKLIDLMHKLYAGADGSMPADQRWDFEPNCTCLLTTDMIESKKEASFDKGPFNRLLTHLVRYLAGSLPSLTVKTGACTLPLLSEKGSAMSGLDLAVDTAVSGSPVLFLDIRERPPLGVADRPQLIEAAKAALGAHCDALLEAGLADCFICATIAFARKVLFGMPDDTGEQIRGGAAGPRRALHEAISQASEDDAGSRDKGAQGLKGATPQQVAEFAAWVADRYFRDAFAILKDRAEREARGETYQTLYEERALAMQVWTEALLTSPNFHSVNLSDTEAAARAVARLVRLDRLPKQNPLEGLMLLQEAWESHDVAMHLAEQYKGLSKFLFVLQLLIVWAVTVCTALGGASEDKPASECNCEKAAAAPAAEPPGPEGFHYSIVAFFLAGAVSLIVSVDALLNAKGRWRQLRAGAGQLESMIWCYRTRVGDFELTGADLGALGPETRLRRALVTWRRNLMTGGDLKLSGFSRAYPASTYTHHQFAESGPLGAGDADDYYSPVQPQKYIELRILPSIAFYKRRTPWYAREGFLLKAAIVLSTLAASALSRFRLMVWVVGVTAGASALTSWQEYADVGRKTMRYTHAAVELENVLSWWKSTSEVERASKATIAQLIHTAEGVISEERLAWMSTAGSQHDGEQGAGKESKESSGAGEGRDPRELGV